MFSTKILKLNVRDFWRDLCHDSTCIYCCGLMFQAPSIRDFLYMFSLHVFRFIVGAITLKSTSEEVAEKNTKRASSGRSSVFKLSLTHCLRRVQLIWKVHVPEKHLILYKCSISEDCLISTAKSTQFK